MIKRMTKKDSLNEQRIKKRISEGLGYDVESTPDMHPVDFIVKDGEETKAVIEYKCRNIESTTYDTIYLSKSKREEAEKFAKKHDTESYFMVEFKKDDELKIIELGKDKNFGRARIAGRFDRGDANDLEPMYLIKIKDMMSI